MTDPVTTVVFAGGMFILGYCGLRGLQSDYRGGIASMAGAFVVFLGVLFFAIAFETESQFDLLFIAGDFAMGALILGGGVWLLKVGHRRHLRLLEQHRRTYPLVGASE